MSPSLGVGVSQFQIQGQQVVPPALQVDFPHGAIRPLDKEPCWQGYFPYFHSHKTAPIVHPFIGGSQRRIGPRCSTRHDQATNTSGIIELLARQRQRKAKRGESGD